MFLSADAIPENTDVECDVCVIGAGAAGISFALEFANSPLRVCVLESGPLEHARAPLVSDPQYEFEYTDLPVSKLSRHRAFGGTTSWWAGKWKKPDEIDYSVRSWVPLSGWPITPRELAPYYDRAMQSLHIKDVAETPPSFLQAPFEPAVFVVQPPHLQHWGSVFSDVFARSHTTSVHLNAHALRLLHNKNTITQVEVRSAKGTYTVRAHYFVLACGGIENARMLLVSGVENEHDQVGRYYMDHPKGSFGVIETYRPIDVAPFWDIGDTKPYVVGFRLSDSIQEECQILNSHIFLDPITEGTLTDKVRRRIFGRTSSYLLGVRNYMEQVPAPENRVYLSSVRDRFGLPKANITWKLGELDRKTMIVLHEYLRKALERAGIGELESPLLTPHLTDFPRIQDAYHHMGTTRMGVDPSTSVVDVNCKLHTVDNLFIAGSSVFPVSGYTNPMSTICALAIRLADYIKENE